MARGRRIAVLASGGFDSAALVGWLLRRRYRVTPVYVRQGLRWERAEIHWLRRFLAALRRGGGGLARLRVLDLPMGDLYGTHWSRKGRVPGARSADSAVHLPGRNLSLLAKAAILCAMEGIPALALGTLRGNPFPDASPRFRRAFERAAEAASGRRVRILAPFARLSKGAVARIARGLPVRLSFSCLSPRGVRPCGRCNKCAERRRVHGG